MTTTLKNSVNLEYIEDYKKIYNNILKIVLEKIKNMYQISEDDKSNDDTALRAKYHRSYYLAEIDPRFYELLANGIDVYNETIKHAYKFENASDFIAQNLRTMDSMQNPHTFLTKIPSPSHPNFQHGFNYLNQQGMNQPQQQPINTAKADKSCCSCDCGDNPCGSCCSQCMNSIQGCCNECSKCCSSCGQAFMDCLGSFCSGLGNGCAAICGIFK